MSADVETDANWRRIGKEATPPANLLKQDVISKTDLDRVLKDTCGVCLSPIVENKETATTASGISETPNAAGGVSAPLDHDLARSWLTNLVPSYIGLVDMCSHVFHLACIETWSKRDTSCPLCKLRFSEIGSYSMIGQQLSKRQVEQVFLADVLTDSEDGEDTDEGESHSDDSETDAFEESDGRRSYEPQREATRVAREALRAVRHLRRERLVPSRNQTAHSSSYRRGRSARTHGMESNNATTPRRGESRRHRPSNAQSDAEVINLRSILRDAWNFSTATIEARQRRRRSSQCEDSSDGGVTDTKISRPEEMCRVDREEAEVWSMMRTRLRNDGLSSDHGRNRLGSTEGTVSVDEIPTERYCGVMGRSMTSDSKDDRNKRANRRRQPLTVQQVRQRIERTLRRLPFHQESDLRAASPFRSSHPNSSTNSVSGKSVASQMNHHMNNYEGPQKFINSHIADELRLPPSTIDNQDASSVTSEQHRMVLLSSNALQKRPPETQLSRNGAIRRRIETHIINPPGSSSSPIVVDPDSTAAEEQDDVAGERSGGSTVGQPAAVRTGLSGVRTQNIARCKFGARGKALQHKNFGFELKPSYESDFLFSGGSSSPKE